MLSVDSLMGQTQPGKKINEIENRPIKISKLNCKEKKI